MGLFSRKRREPEPAAATEEAAPETQEAVAGGERNEFSGCSIAESAEVVELAAHESALAALSAERDSALAELESVTASFAEASEQVKQLEATLAARQEAYGGLGTGTPVTFQEAGAEPQTSTRAMELRSNYGEGLGRAIAYSERMGVATRGT